MVRLKENQSAKLEFRDGYYAQNVWGKFTGADKDQQLKEALAAADPVTDLPLAIEVDYFRVSPGAYFVPVSVRVPGVGAGPGAEERRGGGDGVRFRRADSRRAQGRGGQCVGLYQVRLDASSAAALARRNFH